MWTCQQVLQWTCVSVSGRSNPDDKRLHHLLWHPPSQWGEMRGWGVGGWQHWRGVWHQLSSYENHGGFPRTWYSGNHCRGRASQLRTGAHILATGIPEVHRHLVSSGSRATPMHPRCPHWVASEWLDPGLMVSLFLGHILAGCKWLRGQFRQVTYCGCLIAWWYALPSLTQGEGMFCCVSPHKGHEWPVMSSTGYLTGATSPCGLLFVSTWNTTISNACKCDLWSLYQSVCLCT